jgi:hypothetical protein
VSPRLTGRGASGYGIVASTAQTATPVGTGASTREPRLGPTGVGVRASWPTTWSIWSRPTFWGWPPSPDLLADQARRWLEPPTPTRETPAEDLDGQIAKLERRRTNLALAAADTGPEAVAAAVARVTAELEGLVRRREQAQAQGNRQAQVEAAIPEILRYSQRLWQADALQWRQFLAQANVQVRLAWVSPTRDWPYPYLLSIEGELLGAGNRATPGSTAG